MLFTVLYMNTSTATRTHGFNALNAAQITISIAVCLTMILGFYGVCFRIVELELYSRLMFLAAFLLIAQFVIELLREKQVIKF